MAQVNSRPDAQYSAPAARRERMTPAGSRPFFGMIDAVLVEDSLIFDFQGAVARDEAQAVWNWIRRDVAPDLIDPDVDGNDPGAARALEALMPELLTRARTIVAEALENREAGYRLGAQLGSDDARVKLPVVLNALRCRTLLEKAKNFGRAANGIQEEASLASAMRAMPLHDAAVAPLLLMAAVGEVTSPSRLVAAAIYAAGDSKESSLHRLGFAPLLEAILAQAQNTIPELAQPSAFSDIDLACRAIERFHRLIRALNGYVELSRTGPYTPVLAALIKTVSARVEPQLRDVVPDINHALRRNREGVDRLDPDRLLAALNGVYLLATIRDCRDSLALNALFDQTWTQTGQAVELHVKRNLELLREDPGDKTVSARLDTGIKIAEVRFNHEYAEVLRRAQGGVERRGA